MVVAHPSVTHFSPAFLVLSKEVAVAIVPDVVNLRVGETPQVELVSGLKHAGRVSLDKLPSFENDFDTWSAIVPFSAAKTGSESASVSCVAPTEGCSDRCFHCQRRVHPRRWSLRDDCHDLP